MMAARRVHRPLEDKQIPSPGIASGSSVAQLTVKVLGGAALAQRNRPGIHEINRRMIKKQFIRLRSTWMEEKYAALYIVFSCYLVVK
jgi:hypothetical protein